jgi:EAL and modified HD-GYP domain-containing signal transduction protein
MGEQPSEDVAGISTLVRTVDRVVARQPIVGVDDQIVAFQLLHRPSEESGRGVENTMPVSTLLGDLSDEVDLLVGSMQLFCEAGPAVLAGARPTLPATRTVLEVPALCCSDPEVVARCLELAADGYSIALDAFAWFPGIEGLLELADVVKIDLEANTREQVLELISQCRPYRMTLLASRCLTEDDLTWATEAGFQLFQGPAVQRPVEVSGATLAPSALSQVQLAAALLDERLDFTRIETILSHEPALVVQILHHASIGAAGGLRREVHSVREALVLMGTVRLRQWAAITVLGRQVSNSRTDALTVALVRARMCELLATPRGLDRGFAFTAGLLSALDRLLNVDISEVETRVDVDDAMAAAAFRRETALGELVGHVSDYQDALDDGEPTSEELGNVELIAAMAFCWAMAHIKAIEQAPALR